MQDNLRKSGAAPPVTLTSIAQPVSNDLRAFRRFFREELRSDNVLLDTALRYVLRRKGKQIRPILVLLSASAAGSVSERSYIGATLVELLHTATLVHDDVVDEASERRGLPSLNSLWNNKLAVLVGDYLLAHGLRISNAHGEFRFLDITSRAVQRMSKGELLQTRKTRKLDIDEDEYYRIISDKTASLISACCEIGAVSASERSDVQTGLREYGEELGLAFQIRDDLFDYTGAGNATGKPIGNDLQEKKLTLPLIHALQGSSRSDARRILRLVRRGGASETAPFEEILKFVRSNGGVDYAVSAARGHRDRAIAALEALPESEARTSLALLADFVVERAM
jgi:octaprenyl-diphosphate synthase